MNAVNVCGGVSRLWEQRRTRRTYRRRRSPEPSKRPNSPSLTRTFRGTSERWPRSESGKNSQRLRWNWHCSRKRFHFLCSFRIFCIFSSSTSLPSPLSRPFPPLPLLPISLCSSLAVFRQRLETFLFSRSYQDTIIWLMCYYYHSSLLSWKPAVLAIIKII